MWKTWFLLTLTAAVSSAGPVTKATVCLVNGTLELLVGVEDKNGVAYGHYEDAVNETGWGVLNIAGGYSIVAHSLEDDVITMAAGMVEGALTHSQIYDLYWNLYNSSFRGQSQETVEKVKNFYLMQREWMENMIHNFSASSTYWKYVQLLYSQFQGLALGYSKAASPTQQLDTFAFDFLCGNGDFLDISKFLFPNKRSGYFTLTRHALSAASNGHCSVLIKLLPGYENLFASHSTWYTFASMNRMYKHYAFKLHDAPATEVMSFSSYPGILSSWDDFYMMDSGLVMLQTTNEIFNKSLYDLVTPKSLLSWHRVRVANWLSRNGREWAGYVSQYNSGTYNNQYMILDRSKIVLEKEVQDDALWVIEQIPGYVESGDQTAILREGYWASYNVPFYEDIYNISGYAAAAKTNPEVASYQLASRAKIFRRDQSNVRDLESMEYLMRYNDYKHDPYSEGNPLYAICSRGDLAEPPSAFGCTDTKVTDYHMAGNLTAYAESGPTHQNLPSFNWVASGLDTPHIGQPQVFDFGFVKMMPSVP